MPTVSAVINSLKNDYKSTDHIAFGVWTKADIRRVLKRSETSLDIDEINDILDLLTEDFDPSIGINDEVINDTIDAKEIDEDEDEDPYQALDVEDDEE